MSETLAQHVSVEEYLSNPDYEHYEYVDGEVVGLNVGTRDHSSIQVICASLLHSWKRKNARGYIGTELHCRLTINGEVRFRLPDVAFVARPFTTDYLEGAPELVIEIRSPEDRIATLFLKAGDYFANGTQILWIIDPLDSCVYVLTPTSPPKVLAKPDNLSGGDVVPGLTIAVSELFEQ